MSRDPSRFPRRSRRPTPKMSEAEIEQLVEEALDSLPEELGELLDNVAVMVQPEPSADDLLSVGMDPSAGGELFGLYVGVPLAERDSFYEALPDRVLIFSGPILRACSSREQAVQEIARTVWHELGHHFGLDEDDMPY